MKSVAKFALLASVLVLGACSSTDNGGAKMESDEQAPYAHERTVGSEQAPAAKADHVYNTHQNK